MPRGFVQEKTPSKLEVKGIHKYDAQLADALSENRAKTIRKSDSSGYMAISYLLIAQALGAHSKKYNRLSFVIVSFWQRRIDY